MLAGSAVLAEEVSVEVFCNFAEVKDGLYWTCKCSNCGTFGVTITGDPADREEWDIMSPDFRWSGFPFNPNDQSVVYYTLKDSDYGASRSVSVTVTWKMTHKETGATQTITRTASLTLDAVKLSTFVVTSVGECAGGLCDNQEGIVRLVVSGASADTVKVLPATMESKPIEEVGIVNKCGTGIGFTRQKDQPLIWDTTKIYWYGVLTENRTECCYHYSHGYEFTAKLDWDCAISNRYAAEMPLGDTKMTPYLKPKSYVSEPEPFLPSPFPNAPPPQWWQCKIVLLNDFKKGIVSGVPTKDQYSDEAIIEENYHKMQFEGTVSSSEGGQGDCCTAKGYQYWLKSGESLIARGTTRDEAWSKAKEKFSRISEEEDRMSRKIYADDGGLMEVKAKDKAGYNAAWMYHCTYERHYGKAEDQIDHKHPAYQ